MSFGLLAAALLGATGAADAATPAVAPPCPADIVLPDSINAFTCSSDGSGNLPEGLYLNDSAGTGDLEFSYLFLDVGPDEEDLTVTIQILEGSASGIDELTWAASVFRHESGTLKFAVAGDPDDSPKIRIDITVANAEDDLDLYFVDIDGGSDSPLQELYTFRSEYLLNAANYLPDGGMVSFELTNLLEEPAGRFSGNALVGNPNPSHPIAAPPADTIKGLARATFGTEGNAGMTIEGQWAISDLSNSDYIEGGFFLAVDPVFWQNLIGLCPPETSIGIVECDDD